MDRIPEPVPFVTPVKRKQNLVNALQDMQVEEKKDSPTLPPTPSRMIGTKYLQKVSVTSGHMESGELGCNNKVRVFCSTNVLEWDDRKLPVLLASLIKKMMLARQMDRPPVLWLANERSSIWKKAPMQSSLDFDLCISSAVKKFFLLEDLGHGADGRAFLVSGGTKGAIGVLKFFFQYPEQKALHEERMWKAVYSHLSPVAKTVRIARVMGHPTLLMPWFQCPKRTKSTLDAVEKTLREDFMKKGIRHGDVAWRNVGVYCEDGQTKAVVFDMQKVHRVESREDWVRPAVVSLSHSKKFQVQLRNESTW